MNYSDYHLQIWREFCEEHGVIKDSTPLFDLDNKDEVRTRTVSGNAGRKVLMRSKKMEELLQGQAALVVEDYNNGGKVYDGLIYIMHTRDVSSEVEIRYIGMAGKTGQMARLSQHFRGKCFGRWGDGSAVHIGGLSDSLLSNSSKYQSWKEALFRPATLSLKQPAFFWAKAWKGSDVGIWKEFGPTPLNSLEPFLIGVAAAIYGTRLLNILGRSGGVSCST